MASELEDFAYLVVLTGLYDRYGIIPLRIGFMKCLREFDFFDDSCYSETDIRIIPDAFYFNESEKELYIYEIEDSSPLNYEKIYKLWMLSELIWEKGWRMKVYTYDRYGSNQTEIPIDFIEMVQIFKNDRSIFKNPIKLLYILDHLSIWKIPDEARKEIGTPAKNR